MCWNISRQSSELSGMIKLHGKLESGTALLAVQRGLHRMKEEQRSRAIWGHVIFPQQHLLDGNSCNEAWVRANSATFLPPRSCKFNMSDNLLMHFPQSLKTPISHHGAERGLPAPSLSSEGRHKSWWFPHCLQEAPHTLLWWGKLWMEKHSPLCAREINCWGKFSMVLFSSSCQGRQLSSQPQSDFLEISKVKWVCEWHTQPWWAGIPC